MQEKQRKHETTYIRDIYIYIYGNSRALHISCKQFYTYIYIYTFIRDQSRPDE